MLKDIVAQLCRPGRDPREDLPAPIFKRGILKLEDLSPGMELSGTVLNVVDFGAFVDIGMHDSGLVHVSQLANRYVRDPHEVVAVGDIVKVWVMEIDKSRRRVSLTMIAPGTRRGEGAAGKHAAKPADGSADQPAEVRSVNDRPRRPRRPPRPHSAAAAAGAPPADAAATGAGSATAGAGQSGAAQSGGGAPGASRQQQRPARPRFERPGGPRKPYGAPPPKPHYRPKPKPAPLVPLTDAMKKGKEPLRTFGDLKQFFEIKPDEPAPAANPAPEPAQHEPAVHEAPAALVHEAPVHETFVHESPAEEKAAPEIAPAEIAAADMPVGEAAPPPA